MKKILLYILLFCSPDFYAQLSWLQIADFPGTERDDGSVFVINNKAYCFTGLEVFWQCTRNGYIFDGNSETWSSMASLPENKERQYTTAFSHNGFGYLFGGINCSNTALNDFFQYNPATDTWTVLPDFPSAGRYGMSNVVIGDKAYIIGGKKTDGSFLNEVWEYDFSNSAWTQKNNAPAEMWRGAAFSINSIAYMAFGANSNGYNHHLYRYNSVNDTWTTVNNLVTPDLTYPVTAVVSDKACFYAGVDSSGTITNSLIIFSPADSALSYKNGIPSFARKGGMAFSLNNAFYVSTGVTYSERTKETWKTNSPLGIGKQNVDNTIVDVFPNPANETIYITTSNEINYPVLLSIINTLGETVYSAFVTNEKIDVKNLAEGCYNLIIKTENKSLYTKKLLIIR